MSLSKFARVQTDSEDDKLQLFLSTRQRRKLRGAGARRKVMAVFHKLAKIVSVISSGSSSSDSSKSEDEEVCC